MSQARNYKRSLGRATKNPTQAKIMQRYFDKKEEYSKLSYEEIDTLAKEVYEKKVKLSSTDKEALYDVFRPLMFAKAQEEFAAKMAGKKEETKNDN
jgi:hypothetical protein